MCPIDEGKTSIPCAYFCLPTKEYVCYKNVFDCLQKLGLTGPDVFHVDYEIGAIRAIRETYPNCSIIGCDFHWKAVIGDNCSYLGLTKEQDTNKDLQRL